MEGVLEGIRAFSIPCESWGSATTWSAWSEGTPKQKLSVFPANRGVLRRCCEGHGGPAEEHFQYSLRIVGFCDAGADVVTISRLIFQYSLRIVGFCDRKALCRSAHHRIFQYSLRIVGFCDQSVTSITYTDSNFQYSLRIVGFCD